MDQVKELQQRLEYIFLKEIVRGLRDKTMSVEDSKKWAQTFLTIEPFTSTQDANSKINDFCTKYPQFSRLNTYIDSYAKEENVDAVVDKMREHIKNNDIDSALKVAKGN